MAVTAPIEAWPLTGLVRVLGLLGSADPGSFRPGGTRSQISSFWKTSGLFDLTFDQSVQAAIGDLEQAIAARSNGDPLIQMYGDSQSAVVANVEKRKLAERYPDGTAAPDIDFVLTGDPNVPNGGLFARFPGFYIPVLDWTFDGPEPTNTQFHTNVIIRQYDAFADLPGSPLNVISLLNAGCWAACTCTGTHSDVSLPPDPTATPPAWVTTTPLHLLLLLNPRTCHCSVRCAR